MFVTCEFTFDSAHFLPDYHGKCENMHGHTYRLRVTVDGKVQKDGMVIDFVELKKIAKEHVLEKLDHQLLNDIIKNPSAENVAIWIWEQLKDKFSGPKLHEVKLWETVNCFVTYTG